MPIGEDIHTTMICLVGSESGYRKRLDDNWVNLDGWFRINNRTCQAAVRIMESSLRSVVCDFGSRLKFKNPCCTTLTSRS